MVASAPKLLVVRRKRLQIPGFHQPLAPDRDPELRLTLVEIPKGHFLMGSHRDEADRLDCEGPQHEVRLERFWIGQTPITQAQWRTVAQWQPQQGERWGRELAPNPSRFQDRSAAEPIQLLAGEANTDQRPVERVSWHDAMEFCSRLRQRMGLRYSLPSEAQWEYACRAGSTTPFHFGTTLTTDLANYNGEYTYANGPKGVARHQTTPVASFPANAWGLHDMHGNVWEWCLDHWHSDYTNAPTDGRAWLIQSELNEKIDDKSRLLRGGSWGRIPEDCRSAYRGLHYSGFRDDYIGFRVCCSP